MHDFSSNEAYFDAVRDLLSRLRAKACLDGAARLEEGFGSLNGLTDGYADFLDAIEDVCSRHWGELDAVERENIKAIHRATYRAVYRSDVPPEMAVPRSKP